MASPFGGATSVFSERWSYERPSQNCYFVSLDSDSNEDLSWGYAKNRSGEGEDFMKKMLRIVLVVILLVASWLTPPAQASGLSLSDRLDFLDASSVENNPANRAIAFGVAKQLESASDKQLASESMSDGELKVFKAYYLPSGRPLNTVSAIVPNGNTKTSSLFSTSASCFTGSSTTRQTNLLGETIMAVTVYGTFCSDGTAITSAPSVWSSWAMGGAIGWQYGSKHPELVGFSSSQARFVASYDAVLLTVYPARNLTVCAKLYGNSSGQMSGSSSCVL